MQRTLAVIAVLLSACSYDWDTLDPRLGASASGAGGDASGGTSGSVASSGGTSGTGTGAAGGTAGELGQAGGGAAGTAGGAGVGGTSGTGTGGTAGSAGGMGGVAGAQPVAGAAGMGGAAGGAGTAAGGMAGGGGMAGAGGVAGAGGAPTTQVCATADENTDLTVTCPVGDTVRSVDFASYGTPTGACGSYTTSACHATTSQSVIETACLGASTCSLTVNNDTFTDPCSGTLKHIYVEVTCGT